MTYATDFAEKQGLQVVCKRVVLDQASFPDILTSLICSKFKIQRHGMARTFPLIRKATKQLHSQNDHILSFLSGPIKFLTTILKKAIGSTTHRYLGLSASEIAEGLAQIAVNDNNKKTVLILTFICKIITGQLPTMCLVLCKGNSAKFTRINLRKVTNG